MPRQRNAVEIKRERRWVRPSKRLVALGHVLNRAHRMGMRVARSRMASAVLLALSSMLPAALPVHAASGIDELSLEQLATIQVTSVSKRSESLADAPASIFVITANDLRRSSATTLGEALRLAPNLQVAQIDARNYAITSRGMASSLENKLLVMVDGRIVYSPLFSGVFWDTQDLLLDDVERIEVISGPGATLWGANAVNGVINIITRGAGYTGGTQVTALAGRDQHETSVRHGGTLPNGGHYRVYAKFGVGDDPFRPPGVAHVGDWRHRQAGFRAGWGHSNANVVVQGDVYSGTQPQLRLADVQIAGGNLNARMSRTLANGSKLDLRLYWDHTERIQPNALSEHLDIMDVQLQHGWQASAIHHVVWGGGLRYARDRVTNERFYGILPGHKNLHWSNLFVQDEIAVRENLKVTAGLKLEENSYTGVEVLPTLRLAWKPGANALWWGALSRAVRAPARIDRELYSPTSPPLVGGVPLYQLAGGPNFQSEVARVAELGYRVQPSASLSGSITAFYSDYDRMRTLEPRAGAPGREVQNRGFANVRGLEAWGHWQAARGWRLSAGAVVQKLRSKVEPGSRDSSGHLILAGYDPSHYWSLRSQWDIAPNHEFDATIRRVDALDVPQVPSYTALDLRYGWRISRTLDLSLIVKNAGDPHHPEFNALNSRAELERRFYLKLVWRPGR